MIKLEARDFVDYEYLRKASLMPHYRVDLGMIPMSRQLSREWIPRTLQKGPSTLTIMLKVSQLLGDSPGWQFRGALEQAIPELREYGREALDIALDTLTRSGHLVTATGENAASDRYLMACPFPYALTRTCIPSAGIHENYILTALGLDEKPEWMTYIAPREFPGVLDALSVREHLRLQGAQAPFKKTYPTWNPVTLRWEPIATSDGH